MLSIWLLGKSLVACTARRRKKPALSGCSAPVSFVDAEGIPLLARDASGVRVGGSASIGGRLCHIRILRSRRLFARLNRGVGRQAGLKLVAKVGRDANWFLDITWVLVGNEFHFHNMTFARLIVRLKRKRLLIVALNGSDFERCLAANQE